MRSSPPLAHARALLLARAHTRSQGAEAYIKETRALIDEAQSAATFDMDTIRAIENAAATASSAKRSAGSADTSKLKRIEDALAEAIAVAQVRPREGARAKPRWREHACQLLPTPTPPPTPTLIPRC